MSDYDYNPDRKPAPPAFNKNVNEKILTQAKKFVSEANPDQPEISEKLFSADTEMESQNSNLGFDFGINSDSIRIRNQR